MRADPRLLYLASILLATPIAVGQPVADSGPELIAPAFRAERHFEAGAEYLRSLPDGTRLTIERNDGVSFELLLEQGRLKLALPASRLEEQGRVLVTPLGFRLHVEKATTGAMVVEAPSGHRTVFRPTRKRLVAFEGDGGWWRTRIPEPAMRLSDGTRLDVLDQYRRWESYDLGGHRFRLAFPGETWESLPQVPAPPLVPNLFTTYSAGDGDDWRRPVVEEHLVFAWNWFPYGLEIERLIGEISDGPRRNDLNFFFNGLATVQPPEEMGGALLARRLALNGGDRITFHLPQAEPRIVYILPGDIEADFKTPPEYVPMRLPQIEVREKK